MMTEKQQLDKIQIYAAANADRLGVAIDNLFVGKPIPHDYRDLDPKQQGLFDGLCWASHEASKFLATIVYIRETLSKETP